VGVSFATIETGERFYFKASAGFKTELKALKGWKGLEFGEREPLQARRKEC
jgi:hypothetical protein